MAKRFKLSVVAEGVETKAVWYPQKIGVWFRPRLLFYKTHAQESMPCLLKNICVEGALLNKE